MMAEVEDNNSNEHYMELTEQPPVPTNPSGSDGYRQRSWEETLTPHEISQLRQLLLQSASKQQQILQQQPQHAAYNRYDGCQQLGPQPVPSRDDTDADSEYTEFAETTHAWAVFADVPKRNANRLDRIVGSCIIAFQLFTYGLFAAEAIEDYQQAEVPVMVTHDTCLANNEDMNIMEYIYNNNNYYNNQDNNHQLELQCHAEFTSNYDALVAFGMVAIFLCGDVLQAARAIRVAPLCSPTFWFACLAGLEVAGAFFAATLATSYQLFIGEVTDAVEVGVGLLFIRELSARAYRGIRHKGVKQYKSFAAVLTALIVLGFLAEATYSRVFTNH